MPPMTAITPTTIRSATTKRDIAASTSIASESLPVSMDETNTSAFCARSGLGGDEELDPAHSVIPADGTATVE